MPGKLNPPSRRFMLKNQENEVMSRNSSDAGRNQIDYERREGDSFKSLIHVG